jgi:HD superfamily phosphohydrolase
LKTSIAHLTGTTPEVLAERKRLEQLQTSHGTFSSGSEPMFQPFMSDIIGNTICADLLDYLPRDRTNLGMECRQHERLQRYFTIRPGTLHSGEGHRMSIMVTRKGHGGQRRDVASAVLDIMRERFEMAEAVYYHHKKAAASAMLAKLAELLGDIEREQAAVDGRGRLKPRDDDKIYPAPWSTDDPIDEPPHMTHLSDTELIDYLGTVRIEVPDKQKEIEYRKLQRKLYVGLRYRRLCLYRTLLVIDTDLADKSSHLVSYFAKKWRGTREAPNNAERREFERRLAQAAKGQEGDVIVYCPAETMQSKEIDARVEIQENRIVPLRSQRTFVYNADVEALKCNYESLWRAYIFVSPEIFDDRERCKAIVLQFCKEYKVRWEDARRKVRRHDYDEADGLEISQRKLPLGQEFEFDVDEIFAQIGPHLGDHPDRPQTLRKPIIRFASRANKCALPDRQRIQNRLSEWFDSMQAAGFANRLTARILGDKLDEIIDDIVGPAPSEKAK